MGIGVASKGGSAQVEVQVDEHGVGKGLPGEVGVGDAAHGALGDAGMGGAEALEGGVPAEAGPLIGSAALACAEQFGCPGDPGSLEGVDDDAPWIAEDAVVETQGLAVNLIETEWLVPDQLQADGTHALIGQVPVGLEHAGGIRELPLEEGEMDGGAVVAVDAGGGAGGAMERGQGAGDDFGEGGVGGRWSVVCCLLSVVGGRRLWIVDRGWGIGDRGSWIVDCGLWRFKRGGRHLIFDPRSWICDL